MIFCYENWWVRGCTSCNDDVFEKEGTDAHQVNANHVNEFSIEMYVFTTYYSAFMPVVSCLHQRIGVASRLFVLDGTKILLPGGTTRRDPLPMPMYVVGITLLLDILKLKTLGRKILKHVIFADDLQ